MATVDYRIVAGPSRDELLDAFKYAYDKRYLFTVMYTVEVMMADTSKLYAVKHNITVTLNGIRHSVKKDGQSFILLADVSISSLESKYVEFYYDANRRSGAITIPID